LLADPRRELRALIDRLSDDDAAETLTYARHLLESMPLQSQVPKGMPRRPRALPVLHRAPPITGIDALHMPLFAPDDDVEMFDATIRRWREEPESV
jgi:hypothetical protein